MPDDLGEREAATCGEARESALAVCPDFAACGCPGKSDPEESGRCRQPLIEAAHTDLLGVLVSAIVHDANNSNLLVMLNTSVLRDTWDTVRPILDRYARENGDFVVSGSPYSLMKDEVAAMIAAISEGSVRVQRMVHELHDFIRAPLNNTQETVNINVVADGSLVLMGDIINKSTSHFSAQLGENLPEVKGHRQHLKQAIVHLLYRACRALPDKSRAVALTTYQDPAQGAVVVEVRDEGIGMPAELLQRILDASTVTSGDLAGIGLHLPVSLAIARDHGGRLEIDSEPQQGTSARLILPIAADASKGEGLHDG
jgi:signal transduction histidine kinase